MTPHKQLLKHEPDKGIMGDCYRTAVACLLDLPPDDVPHFYANENKSDPEVRKELQNWLVKEHRLGIAAVYFNCQLSITEVMEFVGRWNPGLYYLFSGGSERDTFHVVVCRDGKMVHDPHPSGAGLIGPFQDTYCCEFLVPAALLAAHDG